MKARALAAAVLCAVLLQQGGAIAVQSDDDGRIRTLLAGVERALRSNDQPAFLGLLAPSADTTRAQHFATLEFRPGATRAVVIERDRQPLVGSLPGLGHRVLADVFVEYGDRARIASWQLDIKRLDGEWRVADEERISTVDNLYRLSVNPARQFRARNFTVRAEDLELRLVDGFVFTVDTDQGVTGLVMSGRGEMHFEPAPETEKGQVRIFAGDTKIETRFDAAFVRVGDLSLHANQDELVEVPVEPRELRRAEEIFRVESGKTYALELGDLTSENWSLAPVAGDFVAEVRTSRFDTLTYVRSRSEPEDISVFNRRRGRNIAVYQSREKLTTRGPFYNEDDSATYDVLDYNIDLAATPTPDRQWLEGRATLRLKVVSASTSQLSLRLADSLMVHSVVSEQYGRLFNLRVRNQNTVLVNLPYTLLRDTQLTVTITYSGRLAPQAPERETVAAQQPQMPRSQVPPSRLGMEVDIPTGERSYLYSSRSNWYPQPPVSDYATARIRITLPAGLACVATGEMEGPPVMLPAQAGAAPRRQFEFVASRPVRYLAFIASRFARADRVTVAFDAGTPADDGRSNTPFASTAPAITGAVFDTMTLTVEANPLQVPRGRQLINEAADIARFYDSLIGDAPYGSFTLALIEHLQPGGHSPAYFAALNQPLPNTPLRWQNDPVNFEGFPEFFLAHEMAHQWWGQAVGWRNYHEQWLSEGFSQYFAALYAEHRYGNEVFGEMLRRLRKWAIDRSDQGPVYLGYRLGHIRNQPTVFRALVYNKGAAVLHMLRRLVGDDAFLRGVRRFYVGARFTKVGTEDFRAAMEAESGRPLDRFFQRWIYGATLPRVTFTSRVEAGADGRQEVVLHFAQEGDIFDIPVSMTLQYGDRHNQNVLVPITDRTAEIRVPLTGTLRSVVLNADDGALVEIKRN